ncbi:MAG: 50S ribosomal protein L3 [Spirochaetes bacterium DG_61]|jgi:large subunit ribosomal protein L3|nr:MAG: 50S ribosomal protein L3 [Spirochaetes bacterium DG_61]
MKLSLLAHKVGMTQIFDEDGKVIPVTVLKIKPAIVVRKKSYEKDGYNALVLGFEDVKENKIRKSEDGLYKKLNVTPRKILRETRLLKEDLDKFEIGQEVGIDVFNKDDIVDVTGKTKGRGFTGVMKRHGMSGAKRSHGTHEYFRHGGSIGAASYPSRVFKGKRMPGRYGGTKVKIQNLSIVNLVPDKNLMLVKGAVPGPNKGYVTVAPAVKK